MDPLFDIRTQNKDEITLELFNFPRHSAVDLKVTVLEKQDFNNTQVHM